MNGLKYANFVKFHFDPFTFGKNYPKIPSESSTMLFNLLTWRHLVVVSAYHMIFFIDLIIGSHSQSVKIGSNFINFEFHFPQSVNSFFSSKVYV